MNVEIDLGSTVPPYAQLRQQITALVVMGALVPGTRLPSIRQLANDLGLAGGTVARAYRELDADGVVAARGARGTTVVGPPSGAPPEAVLSAAARYARTVAGAGLNLDDAIAALRMAFATAKGSP